MKRRNFIQNTLLLGVGAHSTIPQLSKHIIKQKLAENILGHGDYTYKMEANWAKISANSNPLFIERIEMPGMYICRPVLSGDALYAGVCWSKSPDGKTDWGSSGFITILDSKNKVVSNPGGQAPNYSSGVLAPCLQAMDKPFAHGHDVCLDRDQNVYVCQWNAHFTGPIKLHRV